MEVYDPVLVLRFGPCRSSTLIADHPFALDVLEARAPEPDFVLSPRKYQAVGAVRDFPVRLQNVSPVKTAFFRGIDG